MSGYEQNEWRTDHDDALAPLDEPEVCNWCGEEKRLHTTWPARANYFQCRREKAPFVGCTWEPKRLLTSNEFERLLQEAEALQKHEAQKRAVKNAHSSWMSTKAILQGLL